MSEISINNSLKKIEHSRNSLMVSSLYEYHNPVSSNGFAVKYVAEGIEKYTLDRENFDVVTGSYLLSNTIKEGHVEINSQDPVEGICINLDETFFEGTIANIVRPDAAIPDNDLGKFFHKSLFIENIYKANDTQLGKTLIQLTKAINSRRISIENLSAEFFFSISEKIVADYTPVCKQLQNIPAVKSITKKELYKKILKGKNYIDCSFTYPLTIEMIAKECCLSEYHFFRLFKLIFKLSPHQYIIRKRLEAGKKMLGQGQSQVSAVAIECGFSDIHTFSTAFRNYFGFAPSFLLEKNSRISQINL